MALGLDEVFFGRLKAGVDFRIGYGSNTLSGANLANFSEFNQLLQTDGIVKFGINIFTRNAPLFVNLVVGYDINITSGNAIDRQLYFLGGFIEGKIPFSQTFRLTYSGGYGFIFDGRYYLGGDRIFTALLEPSQLYFASLGIQKQLGENVGFYLKALGKYYDLKASKGVQYNNANTVIPAMNTWQIAVESGITF